MRSNKARIKSQYRLHQALLHCPHTNIQCVHEIYNFTVLHHRPKYIHVPPYLPTIRNEMEQVEIRAICNW